MTSRNISIIIVIISAFVVAYLLGRNEALNESLTEAQNASKITKSSLFQDSTFQNSSNLSSDQNIITGTVNSINDDVSFNFIDANKQENTVKILGIEVLRDDLHSSAEAQKVLSQLITNKTVTIIYNKIDANGRLIGKVRTQSVSDVGRVMISSGLARIQPDDSSVLSDVEIEGYEELQREAIADNVGIWASTTMSDNSNSRLSTSIKTQMETIPQPTPLSTAAIIEKPCLVIGNKSSGIYHIPGCKSYDKVVSYNRQNFCTEEDAQKAGFRKAKNC